LPSFEPKRTFPNESIAGEDRIGAPDGVVYVHCGAPVFVTTADSTRIVSYIRDTVENRRR
jgi:hypothetical protein